VVSFRNDTMLVGRDVRRPPVERRSAVLIRDGGREVSGTALVFHDITERRRTEEALRVSNRFLEIANRQTEMLPLLEEFVAEVESFTGCAAVGLRVLDDEGNIPYQVYQGFSQTFHESESPLSIKSDQGMCINIIKGTTDPRLPFYTPGGSFYMNGTTRFLATVSEEEKGETRNVCNQVGYESVALVPIRLGERILGLIHLADPRENMVPLETVEVLEGAAMQLGMAIQRVRAEEALREERDRAQQYLDIAGVIFLAIDAKEQIALINQKGCEVLGYEQEEIIGQSWFGNFLPVSMRDEVRTVFRRLMAGEIEPVEYYENSVLTRSGEERIIAWHNTILRDNGKVFGTLSSGEDITERRRAEKELRQSFERLGRSLEGVITALVSAIEMRDPYTAGHQRRVTQLACAIAREMNLSGEEIEAIRMAGLIHDVGKISIPSEILSKPSRLSDIEWGMIQAHSQVGYDLLKVVEFPWPVAQIVLQHHERVNGSGYPQGLSAEEIMLEARVLAVADVVEAMASHRPYRPARGVDTALEEISQNRGILYDPEVVDACLKLFAEKGFEFG
jgi:PAS domain S-box-containing protein/putative nucleotidyltransferase with HDIG domain